jgi:hypothetical protein
MEEWKKHYFFYLQGIQTNQILTETILNEKYEYFYLQEIKTNQILIKTMSDEKNHHMSR